MPTKTELKQREAIPLILAGRTDTEVAEAIGVSRQTIWKWKRETDFNHDIFAAGDRILSEHTLAVSKLVDEAIAVISQLLKSKDENIKFKVATTVLNSARSWRSQRPKAPGHTSAEGEINRERVEAIMHVNRWQQKFKKQGGKPEDFAKWFFFGDSEENGNGAESPKSTASKKTEKPESAKTPD